MLWAAQGQARDKTMDYRGMKFSTDPKQFVERMLYLHGEIIDEGRMAQRNSQSPQVKELSETLVKSHQSFDERLKKHLKEQKLQSGAFKATTDEERGTVALEKSTENKLKTLSGDAFDQAFLAAQVSDHDRLLLSVLAGQQMFPGQPLGAVLTEMQPELLKLREQAYQLLGQQAASLGTGGAGTGGESKDDGKK
jgi:predicted outer membrane protein